MIAVPNPTRRRPRLTPLSTMIGGSVRDVTGHPLGKIEELMIDLDDNRVGYAVLSFGGFLGLGDKLFAVPLEALKPDPITHRFTLNINYETLADEPHSPLIRELPDELEAPGESERSSAWQHALAK